MRYNTLNPVGSDGSSDPRDLSDNSGGFDLAMVGLNPSWTDRLGLPRLSWAGFERRVNDYLAAQGFEPTPLQYVDGVQLVVQRPTQLVQRGADLYSVKLPASFPATLSGTWATDQGVLVAQVDRSLRQQLASTATPYEGVAMLGRAAMIVNSVAELRLTPGRAAGDRAYLRSYIAGDGKGPRYLTWVPGAQQDDGGMKFAATGGTWLSDLNADGRVDAKFYGLPLASGFCTAQDAAIEAYCFANGVSAWYGPGVYDFGNDNWAWSGPRVAGSPLKDYGGISIFTTPKAQFQTTSANGADVMQSCGIKNFSVQGKPRVTGTLTASSPTHGTNGVSLVYGAENVWFDLDCRDLPGLRKSDGSIDGGQAFTIQPGTGNTNSFRNVRLTGNAINCNVGFGLDVNLDDVVALPISGVQIDIYAEECYRGFAIGGAAPTTSPSLNPLMGVSGSMEIVNCQQSVVCHRGVGADVSFNVMTNKPKASLVKHPFNTPVVVTSLKAAKACKFSVVGRVFSVDTMLEIGGIAMGGGVTADTKFLTLLHKVTSSGSAKEVDVIDFGGGSVSDSVIELHNVTTGFSKLVDSGNIVTVNGHQAPFYFFPGDASISLPAAPLSTAVYNAPLTAVRTVSLPSNPLVGHRLRVERKSTATGGGVNFATAGNLAVGTFAELVYNGSAWVTAASGSA